MRVVVNRAREFALSARALRRSCLKVMRAQGARRDAVLSLSLITEEEMAQLNRRYLSRPGPTDVLAFPLGEEGAGGHLLGDVLVCPAYVRARREEYGVEEGREVEFVAAHGVLHLLGYDDREEGEAAAMERRLREILGLPGGEG